jgi:hypothetical protein
VAQKTIVRLVDDLDGKPSDQVQTVSFALDGVQYEIDLNEDNATRLRERLSEFTAAAQRVNRKRRQPAGVQPVSRSKEQTRAIRKWAQDHGYALSDKGRIPDSVITAFEAAHAGAPA